MFLENVNQTDLIGEIDTNTTTGSTLSTRALATDAGDLVIVAGTCGNTGTYAVNNGFTKALELTVESADGIVGYQSATGNNETPSITHSNVNRQVIIGFVVQRDSW